jgi:hypothetical protein
MEQKLLSKKDLMELGYSDWTSADIIRRAKKVMVNKGYVFYESKRRGLVPIEAVETVIGSGVIEQNA